jgi:hypothetical protein
MMVWFCGLTQKIMKALGCILALQLVFSTTAFCEGDLSGKVLNGSVTQSNQLPTLPTINPKDLLEVDKGTPIDMVVSTTVTSGVNVQGDEFYAKVTRDYTVDGKVVIPHDTIVHGMVQEMSGPKWAGRNGYITARFDTLITPDGREIPIEGNFTNHDSPLKAAAKVVGRSTGYTLGGGVVGALMVVRYGGLAAITASNGYALAGGAAVGGAVGLGTSLVTKGQHAMIQPGAEIRVKLADKLVLPSVNMPAQNLENISTNGFNVQIKGCRIGKDPFGELSEVTLSLDMNNQTENTISTFDIALEDENGSVFYPSPFGESELWFSKLMPNTHQTGNITFNVDNPNLKHTLIFYKQYSRQPLAKISLQESMKTTARKALKKA